MNHIQIQLEEEFCFCNSCWTEEAFVLPTLHQRLCCQECCGLSCHNEDCNVSDLDCIVFCQGFVCHSLCLCHVDSVSDLWDFWIFVDQDYRKVFWDVLVVLDLQDLSSCLGFVF